MDRTDGWTGGALSPGPLFGAASAGWKGEFGESLAGHSQPAGPEALPLPDPGPPSGSGPWGSRTLARADVRTMGGLHLLSRHRVQGVEGASQ